MSASLVGQAMRRHGGALMAYAALAVAITWPLALRVGSAVPHDMGDPVGFTWIFWWNAQHLPFTDAWQNPPIFYPSPGAILFQDSFLGVWPFTTLVQWLGGTPLAAHNLLLIGSFALSAWTAYLLCARLFGDRRAAFVGGLVFGFALYRVVQIPHVNILLIFWVPLTILGLHQYQATRRWAWLVLAAACWALQALTSGYFLVYSSVLVGLWAAFFFRGRITDHAKAAVTFGLALGAIWPWISMYRSVHQFYGFERTLGEADHWAADVTGLLKAPHLLAIWGPLLGDATKEGQLFPGATLAIACVVIVVASRYWARPIVSWLTVVWLSLAALFGIAAGVAAVVPTSFDLAGLHVSLGRPYKPLSFVWISLLLALLTSPPVRRLVRDRSVAGFYALAALAMWILALGPTVRFMGERIWYRAPFSWLAEVPGGDAVRVPARFWLLAVLALGVVLAHGLARLRERSPAAARLAVVVVSVGLLSEAWLARLPLFDPPARFAALEARAEPTPVLELPMDQADHNLGPMYRSMFHGAPVVNGYSGYDPPSFVSLRVGLKDGDPGAFVPYVERMPLDILVRTDVAEGLAYEDVVKRSGADLVKTGDVFRLYHLPQRPPIEEPPPSEAAAIAEITEKARGDVTHLLTDDEPGSFVATQEIHVRLAARCRADEVQLAVSPGLVRITVRGGAGPAWQELWYGRAAEPSVRAAFANPRSPRLRLRFSPTVIDRLQIVMEVPPDEEPAALQDVQVFGEGCR